MSYDRETLRYIYDKTGGKCRYCGKQLAFKHHGQPGERGAWEVDHANPRSLGGTDYLRKLSPAWYDCNRDNSDRTAQSYLCSMKPEPAPAAADQCFIATAAYGTPLASQVVTFRHFRDVCVMPTPFGRRVVRVYYAAVQSSRGS